MKRVVVVGGGPGGYEAALVAAQLGADVTVVDTDGVGGSAVLTDCVPSKTLIATAELMADIADAQELGIRFSGSTGAPAADLALVNQRVKRLALAQSTDIEGRLVREGVRVLRARARLDGPERVVATSSDGTEEVLEADAVLVATGAAPRTLEAARPDGERILTWEQVYDLDERPDHLVVVGLGGHRGRVRQRLQRAGRRRHAGLQPRPGAARRGRRRRRGAGGRLRPARHDGARHLADGLGGAGRRPGGRHPDRRPHGRGVALPAGPGVGAEHRRHGAGGVRGHPDRRAGSSTSTGSRAPPPAASTRPATAPAC